MDVETCYMMDMGPQVHGERMCSLCDGIKKTGHYMGNNQVGFLPHVIHKGEFIRTEKLKV